jgi:ATP-dependent DNA helicase RecQ
LRAWRRERASEQHVPPYVIFQDKTLLEIAQAEPGDLTALAALPGVGQSKLDRYGKGVLETLAKGLESVDGRPSDIIDKARDLRRDMSLPEVQLWQALRGEKLGGLKFRRQHPIPPYVLDFYCAGVRLAVEIDGDSHDGRAAQDARRDAFLLEQGIRTLRIPARDVLNDLPAVTAHIYREAKGQ